MAIIDEIIDELKNELKLKPKVITREAIRFAINPANFMIVMAGGLIGLIVLVLVGGLVLENLTKTLISPASWGISLVLVGLLKPTPKTSWAWAGLIGLVLSLINVYFAYQSVSGICNLPIVGGIVCGLVVGGSFLSSMFVTGLGATFSFYIMINALSFIYYQIVKS